jgi:predicted dinucleotide-binding enzyme
MNIGIIGAGLIGKTLAKKFSAAGHRVTLADAKGAAAIQEVAQQAGATAVEMAAVGQDVDVLLVSIPLVAIPNLADTLRGQLAADVVLVETTNYWPHRDNRIEAIEQGAVASVWVQEQFGRPVVKAFSNINAYSLRAEGQPKGSSGRIALAVAGDEPSAKQLVLGLVNDAGFDALDAGSLADSWRQQPGSPAYCTDLTLPELAAARQNARREALTENQQASFAKMQEKGQDYFDILLSGKYPAGFVDHAVDIFREVNGLPPRN